MGNILGRKESTKVMKIDGQIMKFKTPIYAKEVLKNHPSSMVLLESEEVKHFGMRAKPLEHQQELKPKKLYFLIELPKQNRNPRRVRSGIQMSAKDRLETLMLARRSVSDLSIIKPTGIITEEYGGEPQDQTVRLKLRLPKAEVKKLMMQSENESDAAEKIMRLCMNNNGGSGLLMEEQQSYNNGGILKKSREKRVGFLPITTEGDIHLAVAAS